MAPLNRPESRGQLLLVTGLGLAALVVVLALVLNAAIYTENYASREADSVDTLDALRFEHDATVVVAEAVTAENSNANATDYDTMHANLTRHVDTWSDLSARHAAVDARAVSAELAATTDGTRVVQGDTRAMTNVAGTPDWQLADDATAIGRFTMTVDPSVEPANTSTAADLRAAGVFSVTVDGTTDREVFVYEGTGNKVIVSVWDDDGFVGNHTVAAPNGVTIDLVAGTVAKDGEVGTSVAALADITAGSSLAVTFANGDGATGTYDVVVADAAIDGDLADYAVTGDTTEPYGVRVVYDATLSVRYVTPDLTYADTVRVSGGDWP